MKKKGHAKAMVWPPVGSATARTEGLEPVALVGKRGALGPTPMVQAPMWEELGVLALGNEAGQVGQQVAALAWPKP